MSRQKVSGIYGIENTVNGKVYYGSTVDRDDRWRRHKRALKDGKHRNRHLQRAWNKYGEDAFRFVWMEDVPPEQLLDKEQVYLDCNEGGYNIATCAEAFMRGRKLGPQSEEHRRKIGDKSRGRVKSEETRKKLSDAARKREELRWRNNAMLQEQLKRLY